MPRLVPVPLLLAAILLSPAFASAQQFGLQLIRPDSMIGWDHGNPSPRGWTNEEGRLLGTEGAAPLTSAWTFGDFDLRWQWSVERGGALIVRLLDVPEGEGLTIRLAEDAYCGRLQEGDRVREQGIAVDRRGRHTAELRRQDNRLALTVDGQWVYEIPIDRHRRLGLGFAVEGPGASVANLRVEEPGGRELFNRRDLEGWWTRGDITKWHAENDEIVLRGRAGDYLRAEGEYGNYTWSSEVMVEKGGNSGLSVRTATEGWPTADGMEIQILDTPYDAPIRDQPYGSIYGHALPLTRADRSERWNRLVVKADGPMVTAWVNGEMVQHVNMAHHPELKHRPPQGWIGYQDHSAWVRVRNVRMLEAPEGDGLAVWHRPPAPTAATTLLDRLLNLEALSKADRIETGVAYRPFVDEERGERTIAELTGPGAVVRIAGIGDEGELAFYFDGEEEPRLVCSPGELASRLPHVGADNQPLLTFVGYRERLRVVLRGAERGSYRFDYVMLPGNLPVETFTDAASVFPRGWLDAAATHLRWFGSGRFRRHTPYPQHASERTTLAAGETGELLDVEGEGVVTQLTLNGSRSLLENNDLWIHVRVDGEAEPAVSAPVRFLFPGLVGNYGNYVLADQDGPTTMLAFPFGNGFSVALENRGGRDLEEIGVAATVTPLAGAADRLRLRGAFIPGGEGKALVERSGRGRWVGLVYEIPKEGESGIEGLSVDNRPVEGWSADDFDAFLGAGEEFRRHLSGRADPLLWRFLVLAPVEYEESLLLKTTGNRLGDRLLFFYE